MPIVEHLTIDEAEALAKGLVSSAKAVLDSIKTVRKTRAGLQAAGATENEIQPVLAAMFAGIEDAVEAIQDEVCVNLDAALTNGPSYQWQPGVDNGIISLTFTHDTPGAGETTITAEVVTGYTPFSVVGTGDTIVVRGTTNFNGSWEVVSATNTTIVLTLDQSVTESSTRAILNLWKTSEA